ncbi:MAG: hypothetical protein ACTTK5_03800 [Candidatus Fimenecus sp.]
MSQYIKNRFFKYSFFTVFIILLAAIQNVWGLFPTVLGARACLLLPFVISISIFEKELSSAVFGAFAGMLWDLGGNLKGYNVFILFLTAVFFSVMIRTVFRRNLKTALMFSFIGCIAYFLFYTIFKENAQFWLFFRYHLISAAYSAVFILLFYFLIQHIENRFKDRSI